ncbi:unannotated protein [freshwater metagenome]|uniref:Unannotated protein n=1 Tax=freshwater metagenome TaxID=449393 RepID=A0A6J7FM38_9ZZZZ|nr:hypothetical protein [Actinomycetota bacterium]
MIRAVVALQVHLGVPIEKGLQMDPQLSDALIREAALVQQHQQPERHTSDGYAA